MSENHSLNHIDQEQGNTRNTIIVDNKLIREKHLQLKDEAFAPLNVLILQNEYTVYVHIQCNWFQLKLMMSSKPGKTFSEIYSTFGREEELDGNTVEAHQKLIT